MASTTSCLVLNPLPLRLGHSAPRATCRPATVSVSAHPGRCSSALTTRRGLLLMLTAVPWARQQPATAQDIPLFGLRRKVEKAEEILKEGIETAEKGVETAEREIEAAEIGIETAVSFDGLAQAGAVAGAEAVGVLVATSVVKGILGPEGGKM